MFTQVSIGYSFTTFVIISEATLNKCFSICKSDFTLLNNFAAEAALSGCMMIVLGTVYGSK